MSLGETPRWAVSIVAIVAALASAWIVIDSRDPVSKRNADRIQVGMTRQQVLEIMGREADGTEADDDDALGHEVLAWQQKSRNAILLVFFVNGRVRRVNFSMADMEASSWTRFIRWVGF